MVVRTPINSMHDCHARHMGAMIAFLLFRMVPTPKFGGVANLLALLCFAMLCLPLCS